MGSSSKEPQAINLNGEAIHNVSSKGIEFPDHFPSNIKEHFQDKEVTMIKGWGPNTFDSPQRLMVDIYLLVIQANTLPIVTDASEVIYTHKLTSKGTRTYSRRKAYGPTLQITLQDSGGNQIFSNSNENVDWICDNSSRYFRAFKVGRDIPEATHRLFARELGGRFWDC